MNNELIAVLEYLENERGIDRETLLTLIEESLVSAARKAVGPAKDLQVKIDRKTGDIQAIACLKVVESVHDPESEISLRAAQQRFPEITMDAEVEWEVTPENFGRIAAQTAKQVIMHRLRQAEKQHVCEEFEDMINHLVTGVVRRVERGDIIIDLNRAEAIMKYNDRIPGEEYQPGDHITALLVEVSADRSGVPLSVSRAHPDFVRRLFEREVTEISENLVEIKGVAREPGYRTKIAVHSSEPRIDPVGACVGMRGNRVKTIVRELAGEKVDIIRWESDIRAFVTNALQPAKLAAVEVDKNNKQLSVTVPEDQLSLAIGKKGQNARLAAKLTGWRIDINKHEKVAKDDFVDKIQRAIQALANIPEIGNEAAAKLVASGFLSLEGIVAADTEDIAAIEGIDEERASQIVQAAHRQLGE